MSLTKVINQSINQINNQINQVSDAETFSCCPIAGVGTGKQRHHTNEDVVVTEVSKMFLIEVPKEGANMRNHGTKRKLSQRKRSNKKSKGDLTLTLQRER